MELILYTLLVIFAIYIVARFSSYKSSKSSKKDKKSISNVNYEMQNSQHLQNFKTDNISFQMDISLDPYFLILDTETNGLPKDYNLSYKDLENWPEILQLSYMIFSKEGILIKEVNHFMNVSSNLDSQAYKVHGISGEILELKGIDPEIVLNEFSKDISKVKYLVAHNVSFDSKILKSSLFRHNLKPSISFQNIHLVCTMKLTSDYVGIQRKYGGFKYPKLAELYGKLFYNNTDVKYGGMHNALNDVYVLSKSFFELLELKVIDLQYFERIDENRIKVKEYLRKEKEIKSFHLIKKPILQLNEVNLELNIIEDMSKYIDILSFIKLDKYDCLELLINLDGLEIDKELKGKNSYTTLKTMDIGVTKKYYKVNYAIASMMIKFAIDYFNLNSEIKSLKLVLKNKSYHPATGLEGNYKFIECIVDRDVINSININKIVPIETLKLFKPKMKFLKTKGFQILE